MTKQNEIYLCEHCGNVVAIVRGNGAPLVCCGQKMVLQEENTKDAAVEKHVPVIEKTESGLTVTVGSVAHPMEEEHFIEWIEVVGDKVSGRKFLNPGDEPKVEFGCCCNCGEISVRAYCNLHGLWKAE